MPIDEDIAILDRKVMQLKLDYERYFLGTRPREPIQLRGEVQKLVAQLSNQAIQNTALRFKFGSICSRYQAFKRQWNETLRKIEDGTYSRHRFKAELHEHERGLDEAHEGAAGVADALFEDYREARRRCGQSVENLSPEKLAAILERQREELRRRFGDAEFRFKVVIEDGKAKLKASRAA
jgi:hypothetical protein